MWRNAFICGEIEKVFTNLMIVTKSHYRKTINMTKLSKVLCKISIW